MAEVASPILSGAAQVLAETITSEKSYLHEIRTCLEVFLRPLRLIIVKDPIITPKELDALECNLEEILSLGKALLFELEKGKKCTGQVFADEAENIRRVYVRFISGYLDAFTTHAHLTKQRTKRKNASQTYGQYIREASIRQNARVRNRTLPDFYILPIQRVPRYRLLLIELWRQTAPSLERDWVKEAILRISSVATEMNRSISHATSRKRLIRQESLKRIDVEQKDAEAELFAEEEEEEEKALDNLATLTQSLYRTRNPTMFNLDAPRLEDGEADDDINTREEELEHLSLTRGWRVRTRAPTSNVFALFQVVTRPDPFADVRHPREVPQTPKSHPLNGDPHALGFEFRRLGQPRRRPKKPAHATRSKKIPTPMQLVSRLVTGIYAPTVTQKPFHPKSGDIVVVGPIRSGQTPILHVIECLRSGTIVSVASLLDRVAWLESDDWDKIAPFSPNGRLIKTHGPLNQAFGGVLQPASKGSVPEFKVVALLRHPADLRLSLFRHCRRLYRKCSSLDERENAEMMKFDELAKVDDFELALPSYEAYVTDVLNVALSLESPQLKIVFYEQLVAQPKKVVQQLAQFIGVSGSSSDSRDLIESITRVIKCEAEYPLPRDPARRFGSMGQGHNWFGKDSLAHMAEMWKENVAKAFPNYDSYEALYFGSTHNSLQAIQSGSLGTIAKPKVARSQASVLTMGSAKTNTSTTSSVLKQLGQSMLAPITRIARSSSMIILKPTTPSANQSDVGTTSTTRPSSIRVSLRSMISGNGSPPRSIFEVNGVGREEQDQSPLSTPRPALSRQGRLTHLGVHTQRERQMFAEQNNIKGDWESDGSTIPSGQTPVNAAQLFIAKKGQALDPDDSDDESSAAKETEGGFEGSGQPKNGPGRSVPNLVGERM